MQLLDTDIVKDSASQDTNSLSSLFLNALHMTNGRSVSLFSSIAFELVQIFYIEFLMNCYTLLQIDSKR